jgi:hypothetical protein
MTTSDTNRSDTFDDPEGQIARIKERLEEVKIEVKTASPARRTELDWWVFGSRKQIWRLNEVANARRRGEHRFIIHEARGEKLWAVCSCGARFAGTMHEDFTLEDFAMLDGHTGE